MARDTVIKATIDIGAKITDFENGLKNIQKTLNQLHLSNELQNEFKGLSEEFTKEINNIRAKTADNKIKLVDEKGLRDSFDHIGTMWNEMVSMLRSKGIRDAGLDNYEKALEQLIKLSEKYQNSISNSSDIKKVTKDLEDQEKVVKNLGRDLDQVYRTRENRQIKVNAADSDLQKAAAISLEKEQQALDDAKARLEITKQIANKTAEQYKQQDYLANHESARGWNAAYKSFQKNEQAAALKELPALEQAVTQAEAELAQAIANRDKAINSAQKSLDSANQELEKQNSIVTETEIAYNAANDVLKNLESDLANLKSEQFENIRKEIDKIDFDKLGIPKQDVSSGKELLDWITKLQIESTDAAEQLINKLSPAIKNAGENARQARSGFEQGARGVKELAATESDIERLAKRITAFFTIDNAVRLFKRAVKSATETVKELDKVMTETAVVTDFSISDMWKQLPEYTKRANELGLAVKDVYEASTLYYQQGLRTEEVMSVTNATLRMARIASLDAAEATDRMTNALRGFNMEINENNADNIADVYSKLAAISASDVDEISTAMTKVASLANSANMSFENTAAFLSQIIETTRESAETAGTALKTVIARFSEVKELYSKGELLGETEEGEEIDVNKVSQALRTAGINLNEFLTGQKGLDAIFMELASKWDDLDIVQQRYIATMAAGSRQQSRFIALMSDYKRTQELTTAAQNANGASMEQYGKTLESIETKVNILKNAWNEFLMGIANNEAIGFVIDALTKIIQAVNKLTDGLSGGNGLIKSISNIGVAVFGLKTSGSIVKKILGDPKTESQGWLTQFLLGIKKQSGDFTKEGFNTGKYYSDGFFRSVKKSGGLKEALKYTFKSKMSASDLGLKTVNFDDINFKIRTNKNNFDNIFNELIKNQDWGKIDENKRKQLFDLATEYSNGTLSQKEFIQSLKDSGVQMDLTGEQADKLGIKFRNTTGSINTMSTAFTSIGGVMVGVTSIIEKFTGKQTPLTKGIKAAGMALMAFGAILPMVSKQAWLFAGETTAAIDSIPIIGWAAAIISALIGVGAAFAAWHKTEKEKAEEAAEALDSAKEAATSTKEAYENLNSSLDKIGEQETEIEKLTKGTQAWQKAVKEHNEQVMALIGTYKELNVVSKGGVLTFTNADEIEKLYQERANLSSMNAVAAEIASARASFNYEHSGEFKGLSSEKQKEVYDTLAALVNKGEIWDAKSLTRQVELLYGQEIDSETSELRNTIAAQVFTDTYDDTKAQLFFEHIRDYASGLEQLSALENNFYVSVGNAAAAISGLNNDQSKYIDSLVNTTEYVQEFDQSLSKFGSESTLTEGALQQAIDAGLYENFDQVKEAYKKYVSKLTGVAEGNVRSDGSFNLNGVEHSFIEYGKGFESELIKKQLVPLYKNLTITLDTFAKNGNNQQKAIAKVFEEGGGNLTAADLEKLFEGRKDFMTMTEEEIENAAIELFNVLTTQGYDLGNQALFTQGLTENVLETQQAYNLLNNEAFKGFGTEVIKSFNNNFKDYIQDLSGFGNEILGEFENFGLTDRSQQEKAIKLLSGVDLSSKSDLEATRTQLEDYGIEVAKDKWDEFINFVIDRVGALDKIDLSHFRENVSDIKKTVKELKEGTHDSVFTQEEYDKIKPYVDENDFQQSAYGVFYVGDDFEGLGNKIQEAIGDGFAEVDKILNQKLGLEDVYEQAKIEGEKVAAFAKYQSSDVAQIMSERGGMSSTQIQEYLDSVANSAYNRELLHSVLEQEGTNTKLLEIPGLADLVDENGQIKEELFNALSPEKIESYLAELETIVGSKSVLEGEKANSEIEKRIEGGVNSFINRGILEDSIERQEAQKYDQIALKELLTDLNLGEEIAQGLLGNFSEINTRKEIADTYNSGLVLQRAKIDGLDPKQVKEYADELLRLNKVEDNNIATALEMSAAYIKASESTEQIIDSIKDWKTLIGENGPLGKGRPFELDAGQFEIYKEFKTALEDSLGVVGDLNDEFFESVEVGELLKQIAEGTTEEQISAYDQLYLLAQQTSEEAKKAALIEFVTDPSNAYATTDEFINYFQNNKDLTFEALMNDSYFMQGLTNMINNSGKAGRKIAKNLSLNQKYVQTGTFSLQVPQISSQLTVDEAWSNINQQLTSGQIGIPMYSMIWEPAEGASEEPDYSSIFNRKGAENSNKSNSGSGADKSEKEKLWKNPYDELYNLQEKVNDALREREQLEHRYEDMLKDHTKTSADLVENTYAEVAALKQQLQLNKQLLAGRKDQISRVGNEMFEDSEGNRTTLAATGATKYAYYDETTGVVQIDYDAIDKITDENLGNAVEQYVSRLEEIRDQINDTEDTIEDINDQLIEIQDRGKEEYLGFEQKVYDAIVNQRQKEIETLEKINDTVTEATNKTISTIQDEISKERQARENDKAEQDIVDKEMRLAYLQRDTSGANDLEIQKLQEEIANDQQSYQDSIIDQTIQEMQDEAERAAEQRQAQIDLLNYILEFDQQYGLIWGNVESLLQTGINNQGVIKTDSELYKLLDSDNSPLSHFGEEQWKIDLAKEIAIAMQGRTNYQLAEAKEQGTAQLTNGTVLTYNKASDKWTDKNGNEYTDLTWNLQANSFDATKHNKSQTKQPGSGNTGTGNNSGAGNKNGTKDKDTSETVTYTIQKNDGPWQVAQAVYGSAAEANAQWQDVQSQLQAQGINELHPGQVVKIKRRYAQGGLADFTGPAWLDGTKSRPEMVLNAADTQNFITLKNILASILNNTQNNSKPIAGGDNYFDIDIQAEIDSDYDVDRLADRIKQQIAEDASYRNVNMISQMR